MSAPGDGASDDSGAGEKAEAMERLERALDDRGLADPRPRYRELLRRLAEEDREAYREAVRVFEEELVPGMASGEADPAGAWVRYGLRIAPALAEGDAASVDETGRARPVEDPSDPPLEGLLLWLPEGSGDTALVLSRPAELSDPQEATLELLT